MAADVFTLVVDVCLVTEDVCSVAVGAFTFTAGDSLLVTQISVRNIPDKYPLKPEYKDYTLEKILELDPLACIQSAVRYNRQGPWILSTPKLFRGKFSYLPAYKLHMEPPVTPKPMTATYPVLPINHTGKLFGIVHIILTGVIDTIILAAIP
ncbi:hypothetical protein DSO57_1016442 [Entomophthora muscae]|uniref:Uncharacterized protein n=1 Tax=Entomophthora muscae TaxID=34485 RepID=A0ACC2T559_9FUNG|nr:hypothetical protein DSO57_1016442 [Entomophthora muscae]